MLLALRFEDYAVASTSKEYGEVIGISRPMIQNQRLNSNAE